MTESKEQLETEVREHEEQKHNALQSDTEYDNIEPVPMKEYQEQTKKSIFFNFVKAVIAGAVLGFVILYAFKSFGIESVRIDGNSMAPTYKDNQLILVHKKKKINTGDVVIFTPPKAWDTNHSKIYIKRVVGTPGDLVVVKGNKITVNGKLYRHIDKSYAKDAQFELIVPDNKYFVMGDNYLNSNDSLFNFKDHYKPYFVDQSTIKVATKGSEMQGAN